MENKNTFTQKVDLYPIIFKRKSIRNYEDSHLDDDTLIEVSDAISNLIPLYTDIKTEIKIVSSDDVNQRIIMKKAPHYLAVFSETKKGYLTNVGFMLQQMDLLFSANGIGSCWQGIPVPYGDVLKSSELKFVILIAFGKSTEPLYRKSTSEFKRKPLKEISDIEGADELLEPARLAPSATNSQPWFFKCDESTIRAYSVKPNFLKAKLFSKFVPIDMGIALYHLKVAAEHLGKNPDIFFDEKEEKNSPRGYEYFATLKL